MTPSKVLEEQKNEAMELFEVNGQPINVIAIRGCCTLLDMDTAMPSL